MQYGNVNVDEKYSKTVEPNLYGDAVLQPGKTYNPDYQGDANCGLVKIYKTTRDVSGDPGTPAGDFTHEDAQNELIDLRLNNSFRKSKKIYNVQANAVPYSLGEQTLSTAVQDNQEDWQHSGLACLVNEGTDMNDTEAVTTTNIKSKVVAMRKALRKNHAKPDTVIASVDVYSVMLEFAGKDYTPSTNENTITNGRVGMWLGMTWYEGDLLDKEDAKYYNYAGDLVEVDLTDADIIMYDSKAFHIVDCLKAQRIIDAIDFVGSYAQNEIDTGFRVSNSARVLVKKNVELDALTVTSVAGTATAGDTIITVSPSAAKGHKFVYKVAETTAPSVSFNAVLDSGWTDLPATGLVSTTASYKITVAEIITKSKKAVKSGNTTAVVKA